MAKSLLLDEIHLLFFVPGNFPDSRAGPAGSPHSGVGALQGSVSKCSSAIHGSLPVASRLADDHRSLIVSATVSHRRCQPLP